MLNSFCMAVCVLCMFEEVQPSNCAHNWHAYFTTTDRCHTGWKHNYCVNFCGVLCKMRAQMEWTSDVSVSPWCGCYQASLLSLSRANRHFFWSSLISCCRCRCIPFNRKRWCAEDEFIKTLLHKWMGLSMVEHTEHTEHTMKHAVINSNWRGFLNWIPGIPLCCNGSNWQMKLSLSQAHLCLRLIFEEQKKKEPTISVLLLNCKPRHSRFDSMLRPHGISCEHFQRNLLLFNLAMRNKIKWTSGMRTNRSS